MDLGKDYQGFRQKTRDSVEVNKNSRRRTAEKIVEDILSLAREGIGKTAIVYRANLNFSRATGYVERLMGAGMLRRTEGSERYETTERGLEYLEVRKKLKSF